MRKLLKSNTLNILFLFLVWRILLIIFFLIGVSFIPLAYTDRFLGGGPIYHFIYPELFSWANFDGEHYLSIAIFGYKSLQQAFFPMYPLLIYVISKPFYADLLTSLTSATITGLLISNLSLALSLLLLFKLVNIDYSKRIAYWVVILTLVFPTSFYFGLVYSESLYLLLSLGAFYAARKNMWWLVAVLGGICSATRIFGLLIFPALVIEAWQQKSIKKNFLFLCLLPAGFLIYMFYQWISVGDPLAFYNLQKIVGEQHQSGITLLPQIYYRYVKILFSLDVNNIMYQTIVLELLTGLAFFILPIYGYVKGIRLSYIFYALTAFILPTIQGSLSSLPRYVIVLFPSFLALAIFLNKFPLYIKISILVILFLFLSLETALFLRGYWVA
ncbi:hypothetical protein HYW42_02785 [Candidatus Daviesbacteria bacterium]|nr:hypothetical protein [Candidatus Daviesbacteria bacterium]